MKQLVSFCIKHRVTTFMACIIIAVFGITGFSSLPLALTPNIELPVAMVMTTYSGAGPQEVENLVTRTIEQACASVSGMDEINSVSSEGSSQVSVTFTDDTDMSEAMVDLRDRIDRVKAYLPDDASTPIVMAIDVDMMPVVELGLRGTDLAELQRIAEDDISPALERISGVASVDIYGGYENQVSVKTYSDRLAGYNLSVSYVAQILGAENISLAGGSVNNGRQTLSVRTDGEYSSVEDIAAALIPLPTGGTVQLSEIADVVLEPQDQTNVAKMNGDDGIILAVNKQSGVNTVQVAQRVLRQMDQLTAENPALDWGILMDQSDYINLSVNQALSNIIFGVILAAIVLLVFLRSFGSTAVISIAMPMCIISVFLIMKTLGLTLNMMSLGGITMGVGMIVDNSIVVLENIYSYRADGRSRYEACVFGTGEVALSISASTLTTVAVFLPLGLTGGIVGMLFKDFCVTIASLLLASLIIALTLVPLLCYMLLDRNDKKRQLKGGKHEKPSKIVAGANRVMDGYRRVLGFFVRRRWIAVVVSFAMIVLFIGSITLCSFELMPSMDQGMVQISVSMPIGAELEECEAISDQVLQIVMDNVPEAEVSAYMATSSSSSFFITLTDLDQRDRSAQQVGRALRDKLTDIAGAEISVSDGGMMDMSAMTGDAINVTLSGNDYDQLIATTNDLVSLISALPDAIDVDSTASEQVPEVDITINRKNATRFGLNAATIGSTVRQQLSGATATQLRMNGEEITVSVSGDSRTSDNVDALSTIPLTTATGGTVPLSLVADIDIVLAPQTINRLNQSRTITITGGSRSGSTTEIYAAVEELLANYQLPDGIEIENGGEMESMMESFGNLGYALIVALGLVYFVLASQFESFVLPVIIMMILPIGLLGSLFGLPLTGQSISIVAFIGVIMLAGTVVNSSIVLIDYIQIRRKRGEPKNDAILNACPRRVRPVLMTTLTTILGLLPMQFSGGEGSEMMVPMSTVMITGMIVSTIVTLLFTPIYYSLVDSLIEKVTRRKSKNKPEKPAETEPLPAGIE